MPYTRLRFDPSAERRIIALSRHLKVHTSEGAFFDQLDERAGLGCHDYHLTLVARLHMYSDIQVSAALETVAPDFRGRQFTVTVRRWEMRGKGSLKLVVAVEGIEMLQRRIHELLPEGNLFRPPHHITMGKLLPKSHLRTPSSFLSHAHAIEYLLLPPYRKLSRISAATADVLITAERHTVEPDAYWVAISRSRHRI